MLNFRIARLHAPGAGSSRSRSPSACSCPSPRRWFPVALGTTLPVVRALNATGIGRSDFGHGVIDRALGLIRGLPRPVALSLRNTFLRKGRLALTLTTLVLASAVVMAVLSVASVDAADRRRHGVVVALRRAGVHGAAVSRARVLEREAAARSTA